MSTDIATLGIKVDASTVDQADDKLNKLANTGAKTEASTKKVSSASKELAASVNSLIAAINKNTSAHISGAGAAASLEKSTLEAATASKALEAAQLSGANAAARQADAEAKAAAEMSRASAAASKAAGDADKLANSENRASNASSELTTRINNLKASVDPLGVAQDRVNAELAEAAALYKSGAISAADYANAQLVLTARSEKFAAQQSVVQARLAGVAGASRLTSHEALNLSRQFADIGVTAAMGMNPLMILVQQGPQIADIMKTSGLGFKGVIIELLKFVGILRTVEPVTNTATAAVAANTAANTANALANEAAAATATHAAVAEGQLAFAFMGATAEAGINAIADAEAALANKAVEETAEAAARAETQLSFAFMTSAGSAQASAAANAEAAVANGVAAASARGVGTAATGATGALTGMGTAATGAGAASTLALAPIAVVLGVVLAAVGAVVGAFAFFSKVVSKEVGDVTRGMGLTEKQLERLKEKGVSTTVTMGDTVKAFFQVAGDRLQKAFAGPLKWLSDASDAVYTWIVEKSSWAMKEMIGLWFGAIRTIQFAWGTLPGVIGDIVTTTVNNVVAAVESMINKSIQKINSLITSANSVLPEFMQMGQMGSVDLGRHENSNAGASRGYGARVSQTFNSGRVEGRQHATDFYNDVVSQSRRNARDRVLEAAGDPESSGGRRGRQSGESEAEKAAKEARDFIDSLKQETAEIGKNAMEIKRMAAERAAALAPTEALRREIMESQAAWESATIAEATRKLREELSDTADQLEFETRLTTMNTRERAVATAQREIDIKLRELERQGIHLTAEDIENETRAIIANAEARGQRELDAENVRRYAEEMRGVHDSVRDATAAFGELFGTAGTGFAQLMNTIVDYKDKELEVQQEIAEARARYGAESQEAREAERRGAAEMARAEMNYYGDMLSSAKHFFKEKSAGYKALEAIEKAYRAYQMVSAMLEMINVGKSIILDNTKTASSVANSGARAAADGVAAIAKAIASLPFPLNIAAGAATAAVLIGFGVKLLGGGGKSASAAAESETKNPTYSGPVDEYGAPTSGYSVLRPGKTTVANDNGQTTYSPGGSSGLSSGNGVSIGGTTINIAGNVDSDSMERLQEVLEANRKQTVEDAKNAVNEDNANRANRQQTGGV